MGGRVSLTFLYKREKQSDIHVKQMNDKQLKTEGFYAGCGEGLELERSSMDIQIVF